MSIPVFAERALEVRGAERARVRLAVAAARVLALLPARALRAVVAALARRARPAPAELVARHRDAVCGVSARCAGQGCLQRSVAVVLLCRRTGVVPTWRAGFRVEPFVAHAWVEADGLPVGEPDDVRDYRAVLEVRPGRGAGAR